MRRLAVWSWLLVTSWMVNAGAVEVQIESETIGQAYQLRAASDALVNRRRLAQVLGLHVFHLGPSDAIGRSLERDQFYFTMAMRFDADGGDYPNLRELTGRTPQRELYADHLDLLYAYVGGQDLLGFLDFRLGRQIQLDLFDYLSFDGLAVEAKTRFHVALEAWGGLNVTGAGVFDSPVFRADGVALGQNPFGSLGARQEDALQPMFGAALRSFGLRDVTARLSYVRVFSATQARRPGEPSSGVIDEKLALTARGRLLGGALIPWLGVRYQLLVARFDEIQVGARLHLPWGQSLQAEYVRAAPTFDGDSIWNVFGAQAFDDLRLTYDLRRGRASGYARGFVRLFADEKTSNSGADPARIASLPDSRAYGGGAGVRVTHGRGYARLDLHYDGGYGGIKLGSDVAGTFRLFGQPLGGFVLEGRLSFVHFRDDARPIAHADSFGLQAGARYALMPGMWLHALVEENVNRFYASQLRGLVLLDLSYWLSARPSAGRLTRTGWY